MGLGPLGSEERGQSQHLGGVARLPGVEIEQTEIQKQLPIVEAKLDRLLIFGEFLPMFADDAVSKPQVIVRERVAGIVFNQDAMAANGFRVVFHAQEIVCQRVADLFVGRTAFGGRAGADRRLENQRNQCNQANNRTPKAQQILSYLRPTIPAGRNEMLAGIFFAKKRAARFYDAAREKRRRASHREPERTQLTQPADRRRQSQLCPPTLDGSISSRRFETGRPQCAVALSKYPSNCYGLAGGAIAGDASAPGDAISLAAASAFFL